MPRRVGHDAARAAATARPYHDAVALGIVDEVPYDEEVVHIAHVGDDGKLIFQPLAGLGGRVVPFVRVQRPSAPRRTGGGAFPRRFRRRRWGNGAGADVPNSNVDLTALGDLLGCFPRPRGQSGNSGAHFRLALDIELLGVPCASGCSSCRVLPVWMHMQHLLRVCVLLGSDSGSRWWPPGGRPVSCASAPAGAAPCVSSGMPWSMHLDEVIILAEKCPASAGRTSSRRRSGPAAAASGRSPRRQADRQISPSVCCFSSS